MKTVLKAFGIFCLLGIIFSIFQTIVTLTYPDWTKSLTGIYVMESLSLIVVFGLSAYIGIRATEHTEPLKNVGFKTPLARRDALLITALTIAALPFVAYTEELNKMIPLPDIFITMEKMALAITERLMNTSSYSRLIINIIVIAGIPAICEEFMFRGWIQRRLTDAMNHHIAILVGAIIFSTIHLQFQGFIPRLFLGLILGYVYFYTGSLWASALLHFLNNAFATIAAFLVYNKVFSDDFESSIPLAIASLAISITLLYYIRKSAEKQNQRSLPN